LRLSGRAKRKEHGAKSKVNDDFLHEFAPQPTMPMDFVAGRFGLL
jgi:hypothetical protein